VLAADTAPSVEFCRALAQQVDPVQWLSEALSQGLSRTLVMPFLHRAIELRSEGWEAQIMRCLHLDEYWRLAAETVLRLPQPSEALLNRVLEKVEDEPRWVEEACHSGDVPIPTLRRLLGHSKWQVALAAALGEWLATPEKEVRQEVRTEWRLAILRARTSEYGDELSQHKEYWLTAVLSNDAALSLDWLRSRLQDPDLPGWIGLNSPFAIATAALDDEQRISLLPDLEEAANNPDRLSFVGHLLTHLVGTPDVYEHLLASSGLRRFHLTPLEGLPADEKWQEMAARALDAGYDPRQISERAFCFDGNYSGHGVEHWGKWEAAFAEMAKTAEGPLFEVAQHGLRLARERVAKAREERRQYELTGQF